MMNVQNLQLCKLLSGQAKQIIYYSSSQCAQQTLIVIKPDGVQRGLIGNIIKRFENKGFQLIAIKMTCGNSELLRQHYANISEKPFFESIISYMNSGPVIPMVWQGKDVVAAGRKILGQTDPLKSDPGTVRGDYAIDVGRNVCHGSDSVETAKREIKLWFNNELIHWKHNDLKWLYEE